MMTFISSLFGCATQAHSGPDFDQTTAKVVHIGHDLSVFYEIPGNLSQQFNFSAAYQRDTAKSHQIDPHALAKIENLTWRELEFIDVGKWDYKGKKSEGPNGDLGELRLDVGYSLLPKGLTLEQHLKKAYEIYLNGPKGLNKKYLKDEEGYEVDPEDYAELSAKPPASFTSRAYGGGTFLTWQTDQEFDGYKNTPYFYYVLPVDQVGYLTFLFSSKVSVFGAKMVAAQHKRIENDIQAIMQRVKVEKK